MLSHLPPGANLLLRRLVQYKPLVMQTAMRILFTKTGQKLHHPARDLLPFGTNNEEITPTTGENIMPSKTQAAIVAAVAALASAGASAITIQFDYTYDTNGFFANADAKYILEQAGAFYEGRISDDLDAIANSGSNRFSALFNRPDTGGSVTINDFSVPADTLIVFAGGRDLPGSTLGTGGPGGYSASGGAGFSDFLTAVTTRGEIGAVEGPTANEFAPWGGVITFDTNTAWDFNTDLSASATISGSDFYSVALHEMAHLLGFGTSAAWDNLIDGGQFTGEVSKTVYGGDIPLEADGRHWLDGMVSTIGGVGSQEVAMDPTLTFGTRKLMTDLDLAALDDIGWDVTPVPLPAAALPFLAALLVTAVAARRGRRPLDA
jgi:hypothetical protein